MDSYQAHVCKSVRVFVQDYPHIHLAIIPGSFTDTLQPLDLGINFIFKAHCKEKALDYLNKKIEVIKSSEENKNIPKKDIKMIFITGILLRFFFLNELLIR